MYRLVAGPLDTFMIYCWFCSFYFVDVTKELKKITGKEKKRLRLEYFYSDQSEFDEDVSPRKRIPNFISSDSEKSYDGSSRRGKKPASGRPFIKRPSPKMILSSLKTIQHEHKGIVWFSDI